MSGKVGATKDNICDILVNKENVYADLSINVENVHDEADGLNRIFRVSMENVCMDSMKKCQSSERQQQVHKNRCISHDK